MFVLYCLFGREDQFGVCCLCLLMVIKYGLSGNFSGLESKSLEILLICTCLQGW